MLGIIDKCNIAILKFALGDLSSELMDTPWNFNNQIKAYNQVIQKREFLLLFHDAPITWCREKYTKQIVTNITQKSEFLALYLLYFTDNVLLIQILKEIANNSSSSPYNDTKRGRVFLITQVCPNQLAGHLGVGLGSMGMAVEVAMGTFDFESLLLLM